VRNGSWWYLIPAVLWVWAVIVLVDWNGTMRRRLREIIGRCAKRVRPPALNDLGFKEAKPMTDGERLWNQMLDAGGCVKCNKTPKGFFEGPSGGMSQNVFCSQCGQGYNLIPIMPFAEFIHKDESYVQR
jgi:hypothetical protein